MPCFQTVQVSDYCSPNASACHTSVSQSAHGCMVSCTGLYADVLHVDRNPDEKLDLHDLHKLISLYKEYKRNYARPIKFSALMDNLGKPIVILEII